MKLIHLRENVQNSVQAMGRYSFVVNLTEGQTIVVKNFITGEVETGGTIRTKEGDQLEFIYDVEYRGPSQNVVNYKLKHIQGGQEKLIEDADFNLDDKEDYEILKQDIKLKLQMLENILEPDKLQKVKTKYQQMMNA
jgi:uncharacterized protein YrrD